METPDNSTWLSPEAVLRCVATDDQVDEARRNGEPFSVESPDGKVSGYVWGGHTFITEVSVKQVNPG